MLNEPIEFSFDDCISVSPLIVGTNDVISIENSSDYATIDRLSIYAEAKFDNDEPTAVVPLIQKLKLQTQIYYLTLMIFLIAELMA